MRPEQLELLTSVSVPAVHPDGTWAVVATSRPDLTTDSYVGQLWRVPLEEGEPRRMTRGRSDSAPALSADGTLLGLLRPDEKGRPQVWLLPVAEVGEAVQLTDQPLGVVSFAFTPDATQVVFAARVADEGRYGSLEGVDAAHESPRLVTTLQFQANGLGFTVDRRPALFVVDVPDVFGEPPLAPVGRAAVGAKPFRACPEPTRITHDDVDYYLVDVAADGDAALAIASRHEEADTDLVNDLWRVPLDGGEPQRLTDGAHGINDAVEAGGRLYVAAIELGESRRDFIGRNPGVYLVADGQLTRLTDAEDAHVDHIEADGDAVLAVDSRRGAARVQRVHADGSVQTVADGLLVGAVVPVPGSDALVANQTDLGEMLLLEGGAVTQITGFNEPLLAQAGMIAPQELVVERDGYPVHGWVLTPDGEGSFPTVLMIHGGPFAAYHHGFFDEAQTLVGAGYGVVMCNPRGAMGYGEAHGRAITGDMGNEDMRDVLGFLDGALAAHPELDAARLGIMGGSYGGYLTAWIIAHDHRWQGAIVERGFLDGESFTGASDIGWFFAQEYQGYDADAMRRQSPMALVRQVTTPTLVIHSQEDYRCPISQGYRYYTALRLQGTEAEMLVFPGENHELTRSGTPWHRKERLERVLEWWQTHLG